MGVTTAEFWRMTPLEFFRRANAYQRTQNTQAVYFREIYALLININKSDKASAVKGSDILLLPGEEPPKITHQAKRFSKKRYERLKERFKFD